MIVARWTLGAIVAAAAASASTDELQLFARLLKRQEPGSPSYNCHDNCGQAIIQGRNSPDVCHDDIFLTDYKACLQCAGPDNQDIWQYYGNTLTKDAAPCGLSTTPLSGKQPDVGPAIPAGSSTPTSSSSESSSSASASNTETASPTDSPTATESSTQGPTGTSASSEVTPTGEPTGSSSGPSATDSSSGYATTPTTGSGSATNPSSPITTPSAPTGTGSGSGSGNGTATTTSSFVVVTNGANAFSGSAVGFYGALALGALYAVAQ